MTRLEETRQKRGDGRRNRSKGEIKGEEADEEETPRGKRAVGDKTGDEKGREEDETIRYMTRGDRKTGDKRKRDQM